MEKEKLYIPYKKYDWLSFMTTDLKGKMEMSVNKYNAERLTKPYESRKYRPERIADQCCDYGICGYGVYDFARAMAVLQLAREGRTVSRVWDLSADIALANDDLEFCREFAIRNARDGYTDKKLNPLKRESADENVADIMGMIVNELGESRELDDDEYEELLDDFAAPIIRWRAISVPKYKDGDAYEAMYEIIGQCYEHEAYRTALRLLALLYVTDSKKGMPNIINTNILAGKIMLALGYTEIARNCFLMAARDNSKKRRPPFPEEYREILERETYLEVPDEVLEMQKQIDEDVASGKLKTYTQEEYDLYEDEKLEITLPDPKKLEKERQKTAEKALNTYEKHSGGDNKERLKAIDEAFKIFTDDPETYEQAAYLYFMKANIYLNKNDLKNAYDCIKKAYNCKNGRKNGMVLLTFAIILSKMGRSTEATVYIFRSYILLGEEFVTDKLGDSAMEALEDYL